MEQITKIKELKLGMRKLNIEAIVLDITVLKVKATQVDYYLLKIADESAKINCTLFDSKASFLKPGDIIHMTNCFTKNFKFHLTIYKCPEGELYKTGDFCMVFNEEIDMSAAGKEANLFDESNQENAAQENIDVSEKKGFQENAVKYKGQNYPLATGSQNIFKRTFFTPYNKRFYSQKSKFAKMN